MARVPGATVLGDGRCRFVVWAPFADKVELVLLGETGRTVLLEPEAAGYHVSIVEDVRHGARYVLRLDGGEERADPASRSQPDGLEGPSAVVDPGVFPWTDGAWRGLPLRDHVFYELHVGTFTPAGTFAAAIDELDDLRELGITAIEVMPVAQFPGGRNWGYDGVLPFAVQDTYGGPEELMRFVDACHARGLAFVLDVVYNHIGPEGAHLNEFGPYFSDRYATPWGKAVNVDGPGSDEVRAFFIANARWWFTAFHADALRLDAIHGIVDTSATPFLAELATETRALSVRLGRPLHLIAESDLNDPRVVKPQEQGGLGLDAQWSDDFHHALHALLTGERDGYYVDFGSAEQLASAYRRGFVLDGGYSAYRGRRHGAPATDLPPERFVVCAQNHDQVGNRMLGERLSTLVDAESLRLAAGAVLLAPFLPLLFMGEEYAEPAPFLYFVSHSDPELIEAVRRGRREEFASFAVRGEAPDPQREETFLRCRVDRTLRHTAGHASHAALVAELLRLRREHPALRTARVADAVAERSVVTVDRRAGGYDARMVLNFDRTAVEHRLAGRWRVLLDAADERWGGPGGRNAPVVEGTVRVGRRSFVLLEEE